MPANGRRLESEWQGRETILQFLGKKEGKRKEGEGIAKGGFTELKAGSKTRNLILYQKPLSDEMI